MISKTNIIIIKNSNPDFFNKGATASGRPEYYFRKGDDEQ